MRTLICSKSVRDMGHKVSLVISLYFIFPQVPIMEYHRPSVYKNRNLSPTIMKPKEFKGMDPTSDKGLLTTSCRAGRHKGKHG